MKKIMFDSNVFDKLPDFIEKMRKSSIQYEYYITSIQIDELCTIPDKKLEIRKRNILMLADIRARLIPTSVFVYDSTSYDYAASGDGTVYKKILNENISNKEDAIIADTAVFEGCTLITEDSRFYDKMKKNNYDVMRFDDFIQTL
ncbi:PIN domain-containing protein [Anaerocolumna jejuensis DSM 15929]|uniref:PIN domain-containing protein n=1 Tax=Anaerocolumna jejuensis DSM 15929 TaxID=1121322 RepID=A0A1M6ZMQ8_9FIRM|nr:PIN domain-containing protein [Anaerocolumna jejuensis]SHL31791.1 PIN domain-containing protein [Anaerocolumna jejuensis DSM 15929]